MQFCKNKGVLVIIMVGLPARGKSFISLKLKNYLNWLGIDTEIFNLGNKRRQIVTVPLTYEFYDIDNKESYRLKQEIAQLTFDDMVKYLSNKDMAVAIYDGTNTTFSRRQWIRAECQKRQYKTLFVQSICNITQVIETTILKCKKSNVDYKGREQIALADFRKRIEIYQKIYQTLQQTELPYIKIINISQKYQIAGQLNQLMRKIVNYLCSLRKLSNKEIFLTRHGQSQFNKDQRIGGNPNLAPAGLKYSYQLRKFFMLQQRQNEMKQIILSSTLNRAMQTAQIISDKQIEIQILPQLNELSSGALDCMTMAELQEKEPQFFARREKDKYHVRYPMGESYKDVVDRVEPLVLWLERQVSTRIIIVGHQAINRVLCGYLMGIYKRDMTTLKFPLNYISRYGEQESKFQHDGLLFQGSDFFRKKTINLIQN